jgi:hypothetical protein
MRIARSLRTRIWYALDCPPTIRTGLARRMCGTNGRARVRAAKQREQLDRGHVATWWPGEPTGPIVHRPPAPAGTPRWEACQDCGEFIRTDVALDLVHGCYDFSALALRERLNRDV